MEVTTMTSMNIAPPAEEHVAFLRGMDALGGCIGRTAAMLFHDRLHEPADNVGREVRWADGTSSRVYRETVGDHESAEPCTLVVRFRLRGVRRPVWHALFRFVSEANTVLFAGFPGFVSKLWFAADENGVYRGAYDWDGVAAAHAYVRALWWALMVVSVRSSIEHVVVPGVRRDDFLRDPSIGAANPAWCRPLEVIPEQATSRSSATG
jgi:hypothetical protein